MLVNTFYYFTEIFLGSYGFPGMLMPLRAEGKVKNGNMRIQSISWPKMFYKKEVGKISLKKLLDFCEEIRKQHMKKQRRMQDSKHWC